MLQSADRRNKGWRGWSEDGKTTRKVFSGSKLQGT
jgi:hypothetical protein